MKKKPYDIYLDNAATTKMDTEVIAEMLPWIFNKYGNPGSPHTYGREAKRAVSEARERVAEFMGCHPDNVVFTSGGCESNSLILSGLSRWFQALFYSAVEHKSIISAAKNSLFYATELPVNHDGTVSIEELEQRIRACGYDTIISIMYANNELGSVNDVERIGNLCEEINDRATGVKWFHTDCVQAAGTLKLDANKFKCDSMSISSHKIHGPKGVGALYIGNLELITPSVFGGQEKGLRGGTENVAGIVGFGKACEISQRELDNTAKKMGELKLRLINGLGYLVEQSGHDGIFKVNGGFVPSSKAINIRFDGVDAQTLLMMLDSKGIYASASSACENIEMHPSHVLKAIGLADEEAYSSFRLSFSKYTTEEDVDNAVVEIWNCAKILLERSV